MKYSAADYGWISPEMSVIRRDFLPADLEPLMHHFGIRGYNRRTGHARHWKKLHGCWNSRRSTR